VFCGWDWGSTHHGVCVIDGSGTIVKHWLVQHTHDDLGQLFKELCELADPNDLPIAIERSEGLVVGLITAAGHPVLMAEPAGFNAARPRWGPRARSPMPGMRSCSPTTPAPTATASAG
jgi:Transposase